MDERKPPTRTTHSRSGRRRALVVDDQEAVRKLTCEMLSGSGFECIEAASAETALELVHEIPTDIAVLDIGLPGKSGAELAWRLREQGFDMPIVAVSGQLAEWDPDDLEDLGFDGIFAKPFGEDEFVGHCRFLCRSREESA